MTQLVTHLSSKEPLWYPYSANRRPLPALLPPRFSLQCNPLWPAKCRVGPADMLTVNQSPLLGLSTALAILPAKNRSSGVRTRHSDQTQDPWWWPGEAKVLKSWAAAWASAWQVGFQSKEGRVQKCLGLARGCRRATGHFWIC